MNWRLPPGKLLPIHFRAVQRIYGAAPGAPTRRLPDPALRRLPCVAPQAAGDSGADLVLDSKCVFDGWY